MSVIRKSVVKGLVGLVGCVSLLVGQGVAAQEIYRTVTGSGRVVYSDSPAPNDSLGKRATVQTYSVSQLRDANSSRGVQGQSASPTKKKAGAPVSAVLYTTSSCTYCVSAKNWLAQNNVAYSEVSLDGGANMADFRANGGRGTPLLVTSKGNASGFNPSQYASIFQAEN